MKVIYEPRGRAKEFGNLACNIYLQCTHRCIYCYGPSTLFKSAEAFFKTPAPRYNFLKNLEADTKSLKERNIRDKVFLSFIGDCYQPVEDKYQLTRQAIEILYFYNLEVMILTKGGVRAERDFDLLKTTDWFGVTLTLLDISASLKWEPGAAIPEERIETLRKAHQLGVKTWVSLEPVIEPAESLEIIRQTHTFVDLFKVGLLNYHPRGEEIDWRKFLWECIATLKKYGCQYYIKKDLIMLDFYFGRKKEV